MDPITVRISVPRPEDIRRAREAANLTQAEAAALVSPAKAFPYRTWQGYEVSVGSPAHRAIPLASWELFLLLTHQHPKMRLTVKSVKHA